MQPCTLEIGQRVVVESAGGPLEAEYALFDAGGIELLSDGPGTIREAGYLTTASDALLRLEAIGITDLLAAEIASAMQPLLSVHYALGPSARKMATQLGPGELFESRTYEAGVRQYVGRWLDLQSIARETNVLRATAVMQAVFLCAVLGEVAPETRVFMSTLGYTRDRRPGERTFKRAQLDTANEMADALRALAQKAPAGLETRMNGPSRAELLEAVNARAAACALEPARERLHEIARSLMVREAPGRGPLADPELWAIEGRLTHGDTTGVTERLDEIERERGRLPGTSYLRARTALMLGNEKASAIAERVSSLSANMNTFFELELLAAEAWKVAGDPRKAKAFARDLVENPNAPDELRIRALEILDTRSSSSLRAATPIEEAAPRPASTPPRPPSDRPAPPRPDARKTTGKNELKADSKADSKQTAKVESRRTPSRSDMRRPDARREEEEAEEEAPDTSIDPAPVVQVERSPAMEESPTMRDRIPGPLSKQPPPAAAIPRVDDIPPAPKTPVMAEPRSQRPGAAMRSTRPLRQTASSTPPPPKTTLASSSRPPPPQQPDATKMSTAYDAKGSIDTTGEVIEAVAVPVEKFGRATTKMASPIVPLVTAHQASPQLQQRPPSQPPPQRPPSYPPQQQAAVYPPPPRPSSDPPRPNLSPQPQQIFSPPPLASTMQSQQPSYMRGASQPPFRVEPRAPAPLAPRMPTAARSIHATTELAEALSLPPGLHGQPPPRDELPRNVIDARVAFTHLSRDLGRDYRQRLRIELRTDAAGIEAMQRTLLTRFPDGQIRSPEDAHEIKRHGAFMAEILARQLGAFWVDIGPSELGYWAMVVGSSTRVFPFGRVLRFVQMGDKERDLVSYFVELQSRTG